MAITLVQSKLGTGTTATTSPSFDAAPTSGNLIVLAFSSDDYNGTPDSGWTQSNQMEQQVNHGGYLWWRISNGSNPPGDYTIASATHSVWVLAEFSGVDAVPYDTSLGGNATGGGIFTHATPSLTPSAGNRLLVAAVGASHSVALNGTYDAWNNSFTAIASGGVDISYYDCVGVSYRLVTADGSTSYTTTGDLSGTNQATTATGLIISFKEDSGTVPPKFADKGTLGANGTTTANQTSIVLTTATTNVAIGDLAVVVVAVDNRLGTADADDANISGVTSSPANTWVKAREWSNNQAAAQAGATVSMWYTVATAAMNTGSTITATFTSNTTSDAQGIIGWCFTKPTGAVTVEATNILANDAADPAALDATTRDIECLRIRAIGSEGAASGNAPSLTPTANWTAWGNGNSTLAMTAAEMYARAEHIISVGTGSSSNPTSWAADNASVYVAFAPPAYMQFERRYSPRRNTLLRM